MNENNIILETKDLYYSYDGEKKPALNGLNIQIKKGMKTALMGANGSGKSTFFLTCNGIIKPQRGSVYWEGKPYVYEKKELLEIRSRVGIVFQDPDNQLFSASVEQEISFGPFNLGQSEKQVRKEVDEVIEKLNITPFSKKPTHALSGGQKKIVSIADILVMHPALMILDEPQTALDPKQEELVNGIIKKLTTEGITVLVATHNVDFAYEWADEVILLKDGQNVCHGTPQQVFSNHKILEETNLKVPNLVLIYQSLLKHGKIKSSNEENNIEQMPRNFLELEALFQ